MVSRPLPNTPQGALAIQAIQGVLRNSMFGTTVYHYRAEWASPTSANFNDRGQPDYLAPDPGVFGTGIKYSANPKNPLKGIFCQAPRRPVQEGAGIYLQAQMELYLAESPGDVFQLDDRLPKRQDKFTINGVDYYAVGPAMPCQVGDTIGCWKIELNMARYPVPAK